METPLIWASEIVASSNTCPALNFGVQLEEPPSICAEYGNHEDLGNILSPADKQKIDTILAKFLQPTKMVMES